MWRASYKLRVGFLRNLNFLRESDVPQRRELTKLAGPDVIREAIAQLVTKLNLRISVLKAEDVEINRPGAKGIIVSQIIREIRGPR